MPRRGGRAGARRAARVLPSEPPGAWAVQDHPQGFEAPEAPTLELAQEISKEEPFRPSPFSPSKSGKSQAFPRSSQWCCGHLMK